MILKTTKQWRILLILSCCVGIIAPTLIITAFAMFDTSIIIVKISALQNYNSHVRRWTETYRLDFLDYRYFLFANETGILERPDAEQQQQHKQGIEGSSNSIDFNIPPPALQTSSESISSTSTSNNNNEDEAYSASSITDTIEDKIPFQKYVEFTSSVNSESITFPSSEMIKMYQPLVYIVNLADIASKTQPQQLQFTLQPNENFTSNPIQLYLYEKNLNKSPEIQFVTSIKFDLFKQPGQEISKYSQQLNSSNLDMEYSSSVYTDYHIFDNACFVFQDSRIILEPCVYGGSLFNYTLIQTNGTTPITFSLTNRVIRIKYFQDPYLLAGNLTGGSLSFAMTYEMQRKLGIVFLILGLISSIIFLIQLWILVKMKKFNVPEKINSNQGDSAMSSSSSCSTIGNNNNNNNIHNNNNNNIVNNNMIIGNNEPYDPNSIEMDIYNQYPQYHQQQHSFIENNSNNNIINNNQHQLRNSISNSSNINNTHRQHINHHQYQHHNENNSVYYRNSDSINTYDSDQGIIVDMTNNDDQSSENEYTRSISVDFNDNNSSVSNHSTPIISRAARNSESSNRRHSFANTRSLSSNSETSIL
ncbi:hypothetical protein CYY_002856 [Polysphondylium violaceum]|uniref:Uncharacterized protein n=1 Tax=Polysphondylium violaceum TaxID=133409 RepID=A0A8J4Q0K4_9MYCE|nr:hypothetical protein CYY_002856 [Polysphondylium violaceum]